MPLTKQGVLPFKHVDQVDNPTPGTYTPTQLKTELDSTPEALKTTINNMITILLGTTASDSGAHNVGSQAISGVTGATVYAQLVALKALFDGYVIDQIPDGSLENVKLATDIKVGSLAALTTTDKSSVVASVNEVDAEVVAHKADNAAGGVHGLLADGKIIEEVGSNINGEYIRFSDGTQICKLSIVLSDVATTTITGSLYTTASDYTWTYPASFSSSAAFSAICTALSSGRGWVSATTTHLLTSSTYRIMSSESSTTANVRFSLIAIGRWK